MEINVFGIKFDKRAIRIIIIFIGACLIMTGHFIASSTVASAGDVVFVSGENGDPSAPGANNGSEGGSGEAGGDDGGGTGAGVGVESSGDEINGGAYEMGGNPEGSSVIANDDTNNPGAGSGAAVGTSDINGISGADDIGGADDMVRDGYYVPSDVNAGGAIPDPDKIYIYVTGAVQRPGVYALARSSMVIDAIEIAGGFTDQADAENVNMVYRLESNAMLNIKRKPQTAIGSAGSASGAAEGQDAADAQNTVGAATTAPRSPNSSELYGSAVEIAYSYDGILMTGDNAAEGAEGAGARRVNINTASAEELATLPGIGKATADNIITYRNKQPFTKIEDLMKVSGIKQAKFDAVKDMITT